MSSRRKIYRELEQLHADERLITARRDIQPWFAHPAIWVGALVAVLFVLAVFLRVLFPM